MITIRIKSCSNPNYWYSRFVGKVVTAYTIESGNAILRNEEVERLTGGRSSFKGYVFEKDYEVGELTTEEVEVFKPLLGYGE